MTRKEAEIEMLYLAKGGMCAIGESVYHWDTGNQETEFNLFIYADGKRALGTSSSSWDEALQNLKGELMQPRHEILCKCQECQDNYG